MTAAVWQSNGYQQATDGVRLHTGPFIVRGGPVVLPVGSITTDALAPEAAAALIGRYAGTPDWTLPSTNVLVETPVQCTCTFSGALVRFEFAFLASIPTKGQRLLWQLMLDGAAGVTGVSLGAIDAPEASYAATVSGVYYWPQPVLGSHRVGLGLYGPAGSKLHNHALTVLFVTEQRR